MTAINITSGNALGHFNVNGVNGRYVTRTSGMFTKVSFRADSGVSTRIGSVPTGSYEKANSRHDEMVKAAIEKHARAIL